MTRIWIFPAAAALYVAVAAAQGPASSDRFTADTFKDFAFRSIGPTITTGRVSDVDVDPRNPSVWYVAAASGNLWKTENRGNTWAPVFETYGSYSLGCVTIDPRDSNVVWLGTGENNNQRSVSFGDGVYKSTDAGKTWKRMGLENSEHIQNIVVDPRNSNVVYVTAIGPLWAPGGDRGLYKTTDGGQTWKAVLTISPDTGVTDIVMDPKKPDVIIAAALQRRRHVGQLIGGGPESGLYKTTNGGATWTKLKKGLPDVDMGRTGLGMDPKNPKRVYALITAKGDKTGMYRSDDEGETWTRTRDNKDWGWDPGYYNEIFVDPHKPDTVWSTQTNVWKSEDGGKTFKQVPLQGVHVDYHEIWFDPSDDKHMLLGNDGGLYETYDGMKTFRHFTNLPLSQFYRVSTDNARPFYHVCGGAQDNGSVCGPSRTLNRAGIRTSDWYTVGGGDGFQGRVDPEDPTIVYAQSQEGNLSRLDLRTGQSVNIRPRPQTVTGMSPEDIDAEIQTATRGRGGEEGGGAGPGVPPAGPPSGTPPPPGAAPAGRGAQTPPPEAGRGAQAPPAGGQPGAPARGGQGRGGGRGQGFGRWHWDAPVIISPHSSRRLYFGGDRVYRSDDRGDTWTPVSGDLTRNLDPAKLPIMGKVWPTDSVAFNQATTRLSTITALDESPLLEGLLYAGTDDGLVQISEDRGKTWRKVEQLPGVPEHAYVTDVYGSPRDANVVFATFNDYQRGDFKPYVMKSPDRGRTWTSIAGDLPPRSGAWSIVQDAEDANLLFAGLEHGVFFTADGGGHWVQLRGGIPTIQARDLLIQKREGDLVVGTFGRGAFILDDYTALRDVTPQVLGQDAALFRVRDAYLYDELGQIGAVWGDPVTQNPPFGVTFTYSVGQTPGAETKLVLNVTDESGKQIRRLTLNGDPGIHRVTWDLRGEPPPPAQGRGQGGGDQEQAAAAAQFFGRGGGRGTLVATGRYRATIGKLAGDKFTAAGQPETFVVIPLPR